MDERPEAQDRPAVRPTRRVYALTRADRREILVAALVAGAIAVALTLLEILRPVHGALAALGALVGTVVIALAWIHVRVRASGYRGIAWRSLRLTRRR
jgi:hypothetical protein